MKKILVCEDEQAIRAFVVLNLKRAGYDVVEAASGEEALAAYDAAGGTDIALLDIMLPDMDGFAVCRALREKNGRMGIVMLSARTQENEKIYGLRMGADDYITKPFSPSELLARLDALCRRMHSAGAPAVLEKIPFGAFELDLRRRLLTKNGAPIELTQVEFGLMECFLRQPDIVLSRGSILKEVWGEGYVGEDKIVDVNIRRLRMKIEDDPSAPAHLLTVWGEGYTWRSEDVGE
ncbi:MAG: response regulator transcription factor [Oscillospiraceae bacterium]|nr:response regulator transcription factor [Oscillospiraceae bacterium]